MFIFISLAYATAMPIFYFISLVYFDLTFKYEKVCLVKVYSRTKIFSEELPVLSMKLTKFAIIINILSSTHTLFFGRVFHMGKLPSDHF